MFLDFVMRGWSYNVFYMYIGALQVPTMMMMMMMCHGCVLLQVKTLCRTCLS